MARKDNTVTDALMLVGGGLFGARGGASARAPLRQGDTQGDRPLCQDNGGEGRQDRSRRRRQCCRLCRIGGGKGVSHAEQRS